MRHIPAVKRLLVVHKSWEFSLLHFLAAQHQHSGEGGGVGTRDIRQVLQIGGPLNGLAVALSLLQINNSPRLAHKGQHEHVIRFPVGLRAQRPQTCVWGRCGGGICGNVDVTAGTVSSSGINLQDKGVRPMGLRPSNIGTLEAAEVFDPFPESHRLGK